MKRIVAAIFFLSLTAAKSDGFRCPDTDRLISVGQSTYDVRSLCREPDAATTRTQFLPDGEQITVDEWTFDFGTHYFVRQLRFANDRLVQVFDGKYGT